MPNVNAVLAQEITRLAKRVVDSKAKITRRAVAQHRRDLAAIKRQLAQVLRRRASLEKVQPEHAAPPPEVVEKARFRADGLRSHRAKLRLSAKDYGQLVGVSGLTIYGWKSGKTKPRKAQFPKIVAVRGMGKREALAKLGLRAEAAKPGLARPVQRRGKFSETATEFIQRLVQKAPQLTSTINAAWKKSGRAGVADVTLMRMVKAETIKRKQASGQRGSLYSIR